MEGISKWAGELKKECQAETKADFCRGCKNLQHQVQLWAKQIEVKCVKDREQWGRDRITKMSIKTVMAIAWLEIQMPRKITYIEEETSPRGATGYKIIYEFKKEVGGNIREKLPIPFLWHMMQQAVNLEGENGPDIGYSDYKIRCSQYRLDVKFMKHSELNPIATGHEEDRYEEEGGLYLKANYQNTGWKK